MAAREIKNNIRVKTEANIPGYLKRTQKIVLNNLGIVFFEERYSLVSNGF
jgi:hypothetical protein